MLLAQSVGKGLSILVGVLLAAGILLQKKGWLRMTLMVSLFTIVPGWSGEYMPIFMMLPFVMFYCDEGENRWQTLYTILFACLFILLPFEASIHWHTPLSWNMLVSFGGLYLLSVVALVDTFTAYSVIPKKAPCVGTF